MISTADFSNDRPVVEKHDVDIVPFPGNGLMIVFGPPNSPQGVELNPMGKINFFR